MDIVKRFLVLAVLVAVVVGIGRAWIGGHGAGTQHAVATSGTVPAAGAASSARSAAGPANGSAAGASTAGASGSASVSASAGSGSGFYDVATPHDAPIPKQALRLRIIANSDSTADQDTKRAVRDAVVVQVAKIVSGSTSEAEAEQRVLARLPELKQTAIDVAKSRGYNYPVKAMVGKAQFPTKLYGNQVYPAGTYRALVITLGKGQGANWWCVLFPPLCFLDIADGDAIPNTAGFPDLPPLETLTMQGPNGGTQKVQVRLAVLDYGEEAWKALKRVLG